MAEITQRQADGTARVSLAAIFVAFFQLGVTSFGGGTAAWLYRAFVRRRHWITIRRFSSMSGSAG